MVRPFDELTELGRLRRLRRFAEEVATTHYGISQPRVRLLSKHSLNTIFRVDTDQERFVLRVGDTTRIHSDGVEDVEAHWLSHLDEASGITVPRPIASNEGAWRVDYEADYVMGRRACSLFTFIEGRELRKAKVDAGASHRAGALLARLHEHAATTLPLVQVPLDLRFDRVVYFHQENLVGDHESGEGELFREALDRAQSHISKLWASPPHSPHLLHGDFGAHNIMTWRNELRPIDFQDLQLGFDVQDLGITLADLNRNAPELTTHFRDGYRSVRALPELSPELLAAFVAARSLNIMNLGLYLRREGIVWLLEPHSKLIHEWMMTA